MNELLNYRVDIWAKSRIMLLNHSTPHPQPYFRFFKNKGRVFFALVYMLF